MHQNERTATGCVGCRCLARDGGWTESAQSRVNGDAETKEIKDTFHVTDMRSLRAT